LLNISKVKKNKKDKALYFFPPTLFLKLTPSQNSNVNFKTKGFSLLIMIRETQNKALQKKSLVQKVGFPKVVFFFNYSPLPCEKK